MHACHPMTCRQDSFCYSSYKTAVCMFTVGWDVTVYVLYQNSSVYCTFTVGWDVICTISEPQCVRL